jgi:hypothetical protein
VLVESLAAYTCHVDVVEHSKCLLRQCPRKKDGSRDKKVSCWHLLDVGLALPKENMATGTTTLPDGKNAANLCPGYAGVCATTIPAVVKELEELGLKDEVLPLFLQTSRDR